MKPLPDLTDIEAMAARGRRSALMSARNEAMEELRDIYTRMQSTHLQDLYQLAADAMEHCERLMTIASKWNEQEDAQTR